MTAVDEARATVRRDQARKLCGALCAITGLLHLLSGLLPAMAIGTLYLVAAVGMFEGGRWGRGLAAGVAVTRILFTLLFMVFGHPPADDDGSFAGEAVFRDVVWLAANAAILVFLQVSKPPDRQSSSLGLF